MTKGKTSFKEQLRVLYVGFEVNLADARNL